MIGTIRARLREMTRSVRIMGEGRGGEGRTQRPGILLTTSCRFRKMKKSKRRERKQRRRNGIGEPADFTISLREIGRANVIHQTVSGEATFGLSFKVILLTFITARRAEHVFQSAVARNLQLENSWIPLRRTAAKDQQIH